MAYRADYAHVCWEDESQSDSILVDWYLVTPWTTVSFAGEPTWSPDASRIAFSQAILSYSPTLSCSRGVVGYDIYAISPFGRANLTNSAPDASAIDPAWSPDGMQIAFARTITGAPWQIYVMNPDGSGLLRLTSGDVLQARHPSWSPDSARIAFECEIETDNPDICLINRNGTGLVRLTSEAGGDSSPVWSPDGSRIVFSTTRFGVENVLALMNPDGREASQIGAGIQGRPGSWSPDGAQIAFTASGADQEICSPVTETCYVYTPSAIYMTTPDGAYVNLLVDSGGDPAWMPTTTVAAPANLTATAGDGQVGLNWSASAVASSYTVRRATSSGGPYANVTSGITATNYIDTGLTNGVTYYYVVQAVNANRSSPDSNETSATPTRVVPPSVRVTANGMHGSVTLSGGQSLTVAISFDVGSAQVLNPAEVYLGVASDSGTLLWMDPHTHAFVPTMAAVYSGSLASFGPTTTVYYRDVSALTPRRYWWFIVVDADSNGVPNSTYFDYTQTVIQ